MVNKDPFSEENYVKIVCVSKCKPTSCLCLHYWGIWRKNDDIRSPNIKDEWFSGRYFHVSVMQILSAEKIEPSIVIFLEAVIKTDNCWVSYIIIDDKNYRDCKIQAEGTNINKTKQKKTSNWKGEWYNIFIHE